MAESQDSMNPYEGFKLLRDHETYSSQVSTCPPEERGAPSMLFSDPPVHNRLRKLASVAFKPGQIQL